MFYPSLFMAIIQTYQSIEQSRNRFKGPLVATGVGLLVKLLTTGFFSPFVGGNIRC